ncbi:MAG: MFS transporter [Dehalococcoidia bacterium]
MSADPLPVPSPRRLRQNRFIFLTEEILFLFAAALLDARTLLPAFVRGYGASLLLVALLPVIRSGGQLLPKLPAAHLMRSHRRKKPWVVGAGMVSRLPMAATPALLFVDPGAPAPLVLAVFYVSLTLFSVADSFVGVAWYDIFGKSTPEGDRPWLFRAMSVGGAAMGLAGGALITVLLDSSHWRFPTNYALILAVAFAALAIELSLLSALVEPEGNAAPPREQRSRTLSELRRLLGDGGPFARLMAGQALLGVPALAWGLYTPYALGSLHLPVDSTGIFVAATAAGAAAGGLGLPIVARRWGRQSVLLLSALPVIMAPLLVVAAGALPSAVDRELLCAASFACQGLSTTGLFMGIGDLVLALAPADERPLYIGLANTIGGVVVPLPLLGVLVAQWTCPPLVLWLCPLPALWGAVVLWRLRASAPPAAAAGRM